MPRDRLRGKRGGRKERARPRHLKIFYSNVTNYHHKDLNLSKVDRYMRGLSRDTDIAMVAETHLRGTALGTVGTHWARDGWCCAGSAAAASTASETGTAGGTLLADFLGCVLSKARGACFSELSQSRFGNQPWCQ